MNKSAMLKEIDKIAKSAGLSKKIIAELEQIKADIEKESDLDDTVEAVAKEASVSKESKLISTGARVVCVNPIQGPIKGDNTTMTLYKGRYYVVVDADSNPGYLTIAEEDGTDVGIFEINRFLLDTRAF